MMQNQGAYTQGDETRSKSADRCVMRKWNGTSVLLSKNGEGEQQGNLFAHAPPNNRKLLFVNFPCAVLLERSMKHF